MRIAMLALVMALFAGVSAAAETPGGKNGGVEGMLELNLHGQKVEGTPLAWDSSVVHLLGRDGRLWSFDPNEATDYRQTAAQFHPYSPSELRATLLRELGPGYEVTGTTHYMVAHPRGQRDRWAERFEDLYRSFVQYFSVRGFRLVEPPFPLIGIVCRDREDFSRYSARQGMPAGRGVLGYYSLDSNRITLYDVADGKADANDWRLNAETVIHEATHQIAFNTGVHSRYCPPPTWVVEGLATVFETPGVHDARAHPGQSDRINRERLKDYRGLAAGKSQGQVPAELTASDALFRSQPSAAYAEAWALAFYLIETRPREFAKYLALTAAHPPFEQYPSARRLEDFTSVFGKDWRMLDAQFTRFMGGIK
ncbi:MAG: DUF1570 domain-containing protein [Planctomycetia bacterium]|nr:DUF1570 domain-containing protein [Planctomycetia bacterium]